MEPWYKQLGFKGNPLDARPNSGLVGIEEKEAQLKRVQETMPEHTFIYLDADAVPENFNLTAALQGKRNWLDRIRLRDMPEKKPVLIIDEFQATDSRLVLEARSRWENPNERQVKSIVIAQISDQLRNVPGSFKDRLGNRMIHLHALDNAAMKDVLKKRLDVGARNYFDQLSDKTVDFLVAVADGNARRLLEFGEMLFEYHWQRFGDRNPLLHKEDYKIPYPAAKEILSVNNIAIDGYSEQLEKKSVKHPAIEKKKEREKKVKPALAAVQEPPKKRISKANVSLPAVAHRIDDTFDHEFTIAEQNVLRSLLRHDRMTLKQVATNIHLEIKKCSGVLTNLKKKGAVVGAGKINKDRSFQITQSAKRAMVTK
jgi:hypothetical protein